MDVANTSRAMGSKKVYSICLEDLEQLPASADDLQMARDNFVIIKPQCQVTEILGRQGRVAGVRGTETDWIEPGSLLPSNAKTVKGTEFALKVSAVVMAIGSGADPANRSLGAKIRYFKNGIIRTSKDGVSTPDKRIFAGGDATRGPALIVDAVADGKEAAQKILKVLARKEGRHA